MIFNRNFLSYLDDNSILESEPLNSLSRDSQLYAFTHNGYFEPMDTYREYLHMNKLWDTGKAPWIIDE